MRLNQLSDNPGASKDRRRIGRGIGSGRGKTAGRGVKGQKARSGGAKRIFEGGQMPIYRRLPKRGFKNPGRPEYAVINLDRLQEAVDAGRLDPSAAIDGDVLVRAGVLRRSRDGVRLLGRGELRSPLRLEVAGASKAAVAAVEKAGGSVAVMAPAAAAKAGAKGAGAAKGEDAG